MPLVLRWALIVIGCAAAHLGLAQSTDSCASAIQPDTPGGSHAATELRVFGPNPDGWLFPVTRLDELLPLGSSSADSFGTVRRARPDSVTPRLTTDTI